MGKKKQADFQKTKLRVGRTLPKGRNVTDTSFKSKKIAVPTQKLEKPPASASLEDQLKQVDHHNPKTQITALQWINHYVKGNFSVEHLSIILEKAERATLDVDAGVRQAAIKLLDATLSHSSTLQVEGHIRSIVCSLRCGMTHGDIKVRKDALHFLDVLLRNHPKLLSSYHSLLSTILDMISSRYGSKSHRKNRRTLPAVYDNEIKSQVWRMEVLKRFSNLLNIIVGSLTPIKNEDKEEGKTIYWSAHKRLCLDLTPGVDLEPIEYDLAKELSFLSCNVDSQSWTSDKLKVLIDEITPVLMDVFAEEVSEFISQIRDPWVKSGGVASSNSSLTNCSLPAEVAANVNVIARIFFSLGKWVQIRSKIDRKLEAWFVDKFCNICESLMKGFPYWIKNKNQQNYSSRNAEFSAVQLNLHLSFLCCAFNAERNICIKYRSTILKYLNKVANMRHEFRNDPIPTVIQIVKPHLQSKHLELETVTTFLHFLCESIQKPYPADMHLIQFFTELVTDVKLHSFLLPNTKELFFRILLKEMTSMCSADNVNTRLLECIKRICPLGQEEFVKTLQSVNLKLMSLLKLNNDEAHEVAALLLCHQEVDVDSLMLIGEIILDSDFSLRTAIFIIRTLSEKFSKKTGEENKKFRVAALKFLMNVAVDTFAILDAEKVENDEDLQFHDRWSLVEDHCSYKILPSAQWKRHSRIFEYCLQYLSLFPRPEALQCIFTYCRNILVEYSTFPVHSVIALWKLQNEFPFSSDRQYNTSYDSLLFSCVLFCGVYTHDCKNREYLRYGVTELIDSIDFLKKANYVLDHLNSECLRINNIDAVEYFLRIFYFFITKEYFSTLKHKSIIFTILSHLQKQFGEKLSSRTLWIAVGSCFDSYI